MSVVAKDLQNDDDLVNKQHTRFQQRRRKRQWEFNEEKKEENSECEAKKPCDQSFERIKKKKMAMLLGYCGVDYFGMQR